MTQAQLQDNRKLISLSKYHTVTVNNEAQIEFVCTSSSPSGKKTVVTLSTIAWPKLVAQRAQVNEHLQNKTDQEWQYHLSKHLRVIHLDYGIQVGLLTYGREYLNHDLSIYLNDKEWRVLEQHMEELTEWMNCLISQREEEKKPASDPVHTISTYQWRYAPFQEGAVTPECEFFYLAKDHAKTKAEEVANSLREPLGELTIVEVLRAPPSPLDFFLIVYLTVLYRGTEVMNKLMCPGCRANTKKTDNLHLSFRGCKCFGRDVVKDYVGVVRQSIPEDFYKDIFYKCWKHMKLPAMSATHLLDTLQTLLSKKVLVYLEERCEDIKNDYADMPECLLVKDMMDMKVLISLLQATLPVSSRQQLNGDDPLPKEEDEGEDCVD